jgi:hypothetical protein
MGLWASIASFLGQFFKSFFCKSEGERLGAAEEKATQAQDDVKVLEAQAHAAADAPKDKKSLLRLLRGGMAALFYISLVFLASCATNAPTALPVPWPRSPVWQDELAANLSVIQENSPIISMGLEWESLRSQLLALKTGG